MTLATNLMMQFFMQQQEHGPRLPAAYQEAEYLWTDRSGTYIDTGLKITTDDVIECTALYSTDIATTTNAAFIGDGRTKADSNFAIWLAPDSTTSAAYNVEFSFGDGGDSTYKVIVPKQTIDVSQWHTYKANAGTGEAWVDGEYKGKASVKGYNNAQKLVLFASWRGSTTNSTFTGRMGECRIWRSGELIRHFVPAFWENQKVTGFYDMCTERLYMGATRSSIRLGPCPLDERADLAMEVMPTADKLTLSFNKLEFINSGVQYVDWGDGNVEATAGGDGLAHTYAQPGIYVVRLQSLPACTSIQCRGLAATRILRLHTSVVPYKIFYNCTDVTMSDDVFEASGCAMVELEAFRAATSLAITRLPRTLQSIGGLAFQSTAVSINTIPAFVANIYNSAFKLCSNIRTISFEAKPILIEAEAFAIAKLTDIYVPWRASEMPNVNWGTSSATVHYRSNIPPNDEVWYYAPNKLTLYTDTGVTSHTFSNGKGVLKFASNVTTCEAWFRGINLNMLAVVLPNTVTAIADQAFYDTPGMTWVGMPDGVTRIGEEAFRNCMSLHLTTLPTSLTEIASYAFHTCSNITFTSLPTGLTTIYKSTFRGCTKLAISAVPSGVTVVQENSFQSCTTITQMEFPANLDKLHTDVFRYCSGLTSVTFLGTPSFIHNNAFRGCDNLTDIYVPWSSTDAINANAPWSATNATIHYNQTT